MISELPCIDACDEMTMRMLLLLLMRRRIELIAKSMRRRMMLMTMVMMWKQMKLLSVWVMRCHPRLL